MITQPVLSITWKIEFPLKHFDGKTYIQQSNIGRLYTLGLTFK